MSVDPPRRKVYRLDELAAERERLRAAGRSVVLTNGCFDLLHVGHLTSLQQARGLGDVLIVALNSDASVRRLKGPRRPLVAEAERAELLAALECVDYVVVFDQDTPDQVYTALRPDILAKGGDWSSDQLPGHELIEGYGGRVVILPYRSGFSTTGLLERILNDQM
jgi:D-beta-D-heptose 7-phosphate kinase/D-beta-D-heptose 1-phosphate adenosyltransferase